MLHITLGDLTISQPTSLNFIFTTKQPTKEINLRWIDQKNLNYIEVNKI